MKTTARVLSLDVLRGLVMVIMVIDHAREYANLPSVSDPMEINQTSPALFFTRWISHFCAPVFVMLAGTSARLVGAKLNDTSALSSYLWRRGAVLILLEFTIIWFSWPFNFSWPLFYMQVIWAIGMSLICLAFLVRWPIWVIGSVGGLLTFGHNLFDSVRFTDGTAAHYIWSMLHQKNVLPLLGGYSVRTTYPLLPLIGLTALGYCFGALYLKDYAPARRRQALLLLGVSAITLFLLLRIFNLYGEMNRFVPQADALRTWMALLNTTKYPTSLQFLLMTLGPAWLTLMALERWPARWQAPLTVFGRVPMFYYIAHLYALHILGLLAALLAGYPWAAFDFKAKITGMPASFGFPLWGVYVFSGITILLLYPRCLRYDQWRRRSTSFIARYL